jgi:hypothetical protein
MKMKKYLDLAIANETIKTTDIKGKDYAEVNQRIKAFRMVYPQGSIPTEMLSNENGVCVFKASVYTDDGRLLATGTAYEKEDSSFINKTSYIENCETSAVGRALGIAGFGIDVSVASAEEVQNAINNQTITQEDADNYTLKFGKYKDRLLKDVFKNDPKYVDWMINNTQDEKLLDIIRLATGLVIPTIEEQKEKTELLMKLNQLDLDIDEIKEKYEIDDLRDLSIEKLKEIVK